MYDYIEKDLKGTENVVNDAIFFNSLNFLKKMSYKRELKNLRKTYSNFQKFNDLFLDAFGVSLVKVKNAIDGEESMEIQKEQK